MEYYINVTYECNLSCSYCAAKKVVFSNNKRQKAISYHVLDRILNYIKEDSKKQESPNYIVFYGGEPTLEIDLILYIIHQIQSFDIKFVLYTNGILLNNLTDEILKSLDYIFVSIDGDKETHEAYKFVGSYDIILKNALLIKQKCKAKLIGRITLQEESNLFISVSNIYECFDYVFWQVVNKPFFNNPNLLITNYKVDIEKLYKFWVDKLSEGQLIKIIPFISLMDNNERNINSYSFKCGMGRNQKHFDIDGNVFLCDEYLGERLKISGNILEPEKIQIYYVAHTDIFKDCPDCPISEVCLGRCRHALETFSIPTIRIYCELTKILVETAKKIDISYLLSREDLEAVRTTEQIP